MRKLRILIPLIIVPVIITIGVGIMSDKQYALVALLVTVAALAYMFLGFNNSQTNIRYIVVLSVMSALSVLSRCVFTFLPAFKPMTAIIILTGMYLGPEGGFMCGALTALFSNFFFAQGPWTPFQMFAFGILGLASGLIKKPLRKSTTLLLIYGAIGGIAYSLIMDIWTVLWYSGGFAWDLYGASVVAALPFMALYMISNVVFLIILKKAFGRKMNRMIYKYNILGE
ncbi:MAG: ECF transporter S component [Lachnospiraceae bacterium]|nr:ECF transporter S component [Lachnospiraceae bacterium]